MSPYIIRERRPALDKHLEPLRQALHDVGNCTGVAAGDLAYCLYSLCVGQLSKLDGYEKRRAIVGDLEATKLEFVRKHVAGYEDSKLIHNGDVR